MQTVQIPIFPLPLFLLPGEVSHLHIFEPRYRQMLEDCAQQGVGFGIPYAKDNKLCELGAVVKISDGYEINPDGTTDIEIVGQQVFRLKKIQIQSTDKLYPLGDVVIIDLEGKAVSERLMKQMGAYLKSTNKSIPPELMSTNLTAYDASRILALTPEDKIKLVKAKSDALRENIVLNRLKILARIQEQNKSIEGEIFLN